MKTWTCTASSVWKKGKKFSFTIFIFFFNFSIEIECLSCVKCLCNHGYTPLHWHHMNFMNHEKKHRTTHVTSNWRDVFDFCDQVQNTTLFFSKCSGFFLFKSHNKGVIKVKKAWKRIINKIIFILSIFSFVANVKGKKNDFEWGIRTPSLKNTHRMQ